MCGIAGFLQVHPFETDEASAELALMASGLAHRGPDDEGCWLARSKRVALAHRRLSIVDLSPLGHQPMTSASGRFTVTFNGEIYNHRELRARLIGVGHAFRGNSDTEVLLAAIEEWGLEGTLLRSRGMFAFALWDEGQRVLHLARDRFGEKPLYYGVFGDQLLFASELKALRRHGAWRADVNRDALTLVLRHGFIPAPHTIFRQVQKVRPGCVVSARVEGSAISLREVAYWQPGTIAGRSGTRTDAENPEALVERVHDALQDAVRLQMVADVPVGAFLSGGIDSSLIVALMQRVGGAPVRTFSIAFDEERFNEAPFARRVARHLGTEHTELTVTAEDALRVTEDLARIYDEPFADPSQIPTFLVSRLARRHVTVSLSGDGGDELFAGYGRFAEALIRWRHLQRVPPALRAAGASLLARMGRQYLSRAPRWYRSATGDRLLERSSFWTALSFDELYRAMISIWHAPELAVLGSHEPAPYPYRDGHETHGREELAHMMYDDTCRYLPDDILVKVDRAAMAVSLETRVPFLDVAVAEAAWRIPAGVHMRDGRGKWVLRQLLERYVPRELFDRPKMGFGVPLGTWLRGQLRPWAEDLLDGTRLRREGYFDASLIERRWRQHVSGVADWSFHLWAVLMFEAWIADSGRERVRVGQPRPAVVSPASDISDLVPAR